MVALVKASGPFQVQRGDIFQLGKHRLMCGDSANAEDTRRLTSNLKADAVVSDPPFASVGGNTNGRGAHTDTQYFEHWLVSVFRELYSLCSPESAWFLWASWQTLPIYESALQRAASDYYDMRTVSQVLIHDCEMIGMGRPFRNQIDWIALIRGKKTNFKGRISANQPNIIRSYWYKGKRQYHPSEKSLAVATQLVEWASDENMTVLEPFMGSGTTLLACEQTNRQCFGMEISPEYCGIAIRRWQEHTGQQVSRIGTTSPSDTSSGSSGGNSSGSGTSGRVLIQKVARKPLQCVIHTDG